MAFPRGINPGVLNFVCVPEVAPSTFKASANSFFYFPDIKLPLTLLFFIPFRDDLLVLVVVVVLV